MSNNGDRLNNVWPSTMEFGHSATKEMIVEKHTTSSSMNHLPAYVSFFFFFLILSFSRLALQGRDLQDS